MHNHIHTTSLSLLSLSIPATLERTAAIQRAAEVRKGLLRAAASGENEDAGSGEGLILEARSGSSSRQRQDQTPRRRSTDRQGDGETQVRQSISMWA